MKAAFQKKEIEEDRGPLTQRKEKEETDRGPLNIQRKKYLLSFFVDLGILPIQARS